MGKGRASRRQELSPELLSVSLQGSGPPKSPGMGVRVQLAGRTLPCRALPACVQQQKAAPALGRAAQRTHMSPHVA